ncbi:MAG: OmpA family protein [Myxococcales bacterium]
MRRSALSRGPAKLSVLLSVAFCLAVPGVLSAQSAQIGGGVSGSTTGQTSAGGEAAAAPAAPTAATVGEPPETDEERQRRWDMRASNTYFGPVGGVFVVDAGSGAPKSFRLQVIGDLGVKKDFLYNNDKDRYGAGAVSLGVTPIRNLELTAAIGARSNRNSLTTPQVLQAIGDMTFGVKAYGEVIPGLTLGGDLSLLLLSAIGNVGTDSAATSVGMRGNLSLDLRKMTASHFPLQLRFNAGYMFNNSGKLIDDTERSRLANLQAMAGGQIDEFNEYRHRVRRDERFALNIDRVDHVLLALGAEFPIETSKRFAIHPIAEWGLEIPVNRQGYDCAYPTLANGNKVPGADSCLGKEGPDVYRQRLTFAARIFPVIPGLNLLAGVDIGIGGSTNFVQELAPNAPYRIMFAASYAADLMPKPPVVKVVEKRVEVPVQVAAPKGHVRGLVIEQGTPGVGVPGAVVTFPGRTLNSIVASPDGSFMTYEIDPGELQLEVAAEGYRMGTCGALIGPEGGEVPVTCELVALPKVGTALGQVVLATDGSPLPGVAVQLVGPAMRSIVTDASGRFREENLAPGEYTARVEQDGYLISVTSVVVKARTESDVRISLLPTPKTSSVKVQKDRIQIRGSIFFTTGTADIEARSEPLLTEIADVIMRNHELLEVEVRGHTDDVGGADANHDLSQRRAEAVKNWLVKAGVERERLTAKGFGMDQPIVPNVTPQNRAKNRRVEFLIVRRAGQ